MNISAIRERVSNGFEPFVLRLSDGSAVEVPHPDFIALGHRVVVVLDNRDRSRKIDVLHIVSIDDVSPKKKGR